MIGPIDRLDYRDRGLYPNDFGQAPDTGVNEERLHARVHADVDAGGYVVSPFTTHVTYRRGDGGTAEGPPRGGRDGGLRC